MGASTQQLISQWQAKIAALESTQRETEEEHRRMLQTQRQQVEELTAQNAQMKKLLSADDQEATPAQQERIDKLTELVETYARKVEVERRQLEAMQQEFEVTQAKLQDGHRMSGGPQAASESAKQAARARLQLENRLELAEKRFGEALSRNNALRQEIERFNKDKKIFQQVCGRLERELASLRNDLDVVRGATAICVEARQVASQQALAVRLQADKEADAAREELAELAQCKEADKALMQAHAKRMAGAAAARAAQPPQPGQLDAAACARAAARLQEATGIPELHALVAHLSQLEALNFALFNECSQFNDRVGALQKELKALQEEARQSEEVHGNLQQKEVIRATQAKQEQALKRAEALQGKKVVLERRLALIRAGVGAALKSLGGRLMPAPRPEDPACVFNTLLQNLGQMEARARAVLAVHSTLAGRDAADAKAMLSAHLSSSQSMTPGRPPSSSTAAAASAAGSGRPASQQGGRQGGVLGAPSLSTIVSESAASGSAAKGSDGSSSSDDDNDVMPVSSSALRTQAAAAGGHRAL